MTAAGSERWQERGRSAWAAVAPARRQGAQSRPCREITSNYSERGECMVVFSVLAGAAAFALIAGGLCAVALTAWLIVTDAKGDWGDR